MRIRKEQIDAMRLPAAVLREQMCARLITHGHQARLDPQTGDLLVRQEMRGTSRITFDERGLPATFRGPDGRAYRLHYDSATRTTTFVDSAGHRASCSLDEKNRLVGVTDPSGFRQEVVYSGELPLELRRAGRPVIQFRYEATGQVAQMVDGRGKPLCFEFGPDDQLRRVVERSEAALEYGYDERGRLATITTPTGAIWQTVYNDQLGRKSIVYPDGKYEVHAYRGKVVAAVQRRDGSQLALERGAHGKLTSVRYSGGLTLGFAYDDAGQITGAENGLHQVAFAYDDEGRRVAEEIDGRRVEVRYDNAGLLSGLVTHRGEEVKFHHGSDQRIRRVTLWDGQVIELERDARGEVTGVSYPNRVRWLRRFTPLRLLESDELSAGQARFTRNYRYDSNDLVAEVSDSQHGTKRHKFDAEDRLVSVELPHALTGYAYDPHGNAVQIAGRSFRYNKLDQITEGAGVQCDYDSRGNLTTWIEQGQQTRYEYNEQDLLVRVRLPSGSTVEYEYDAFGRRVVKRFGETTTTYTWQGEQLLAEDVKGPSPSKVDYFYLPETNLLLAMRVNGQTYFYQSDHLDAPIRLTDQSGTVVWEAEPFGHDFLILAEAVRQPFRFPGQYHDAETGLFYNVARYYDPRAGRYLTPDPLFFEEQTNLYVYARCNPAAFTDPSGRFLNILAGAAIGAAVGAAFAGAKKMADNWAQGKSGSDLLDGVGEAAGKGALVGAVGGALMGMGVPPMVVGVGMLLAPAGVALVTQGTEACMNALPLVGPARRYQENGNARQLGVDLAFDTLAIASLGLGARARGGPPPEPMTISLPEFGAFEPVPAEGMSGGGGANTLTIPGEAVGAGQQAAMAAPAMAVAAGGGGGGGGGDAGKKPIEPYNRRKHYGSTPKKSDRKALGAGEDEVVDHDPPLVKRYYEGDPATGEKPGKDMTPEERRASANDRSRMRLQDSDESNKQGAEMSKYSKDKKKELGLDKDEE